MLAQFFIRRPVFAWVIAIVIMLLGIISINNLRFASIQTWRRLHRLVSRQLTQ